jgi:hypothetical protein
MGLESANYVSDLNISNPTGSDLQAEGDNHIRLLKSVLKATFPDASSPIYTNKVAAVLAGNLTVGVSHASAFIPVNASAAARTVTLPTDRVNGFEVVIAKIDSSVNAVTIAGTINGVTNLLLRHQWSVARLRWDDTEDEWYAEVVQKPFDTFASLSSNTTLSILHHRALVEGNAASAGFTVTMPSTSGLPAGYKVKVWKSDSTSNIVAVTNGSTTVNLYIQGEWTEFTWDGSAWRIFSDLWSSNADVWAGNVDRGLRASDLTDASALVTLTFASPSASWSWTGGFTRELSMSADTALANPTGGIPGTYRAVLVKGTSATERLLTFGDQFGGALPTVDDVTDTKWYLITIACITASHFAVVGIADASPP